MRIEGNSWAGALCERIDGRLQSDQRFKARFEAVGASAPLALEGGKRIAKGSAKLIEALWSKQTSVQGAAQLLQGGGVELLAAVYALFVGVFAPELVTKRCHALDIVRSDAAILGEESLLERMSTACWKQFQGLQRVVERHPVAAATLVAGVLVYGMGRLFAADGLPPGPTGGMQATDPPEQPDLGMCPYRQPSLMLAADGAFSQPKFEMPLPWRPIARPIVPVSDVAKPLLMLTAEKLPALDITQAALPPMVDTPQLVPPPAVDMPQWVPPTVESVPAPSVPVPKVFSPPVVQWRPERNTTVVDRSNETAASVTVVTQQGPLKDDGEKLLIDEVQSIVEQLGLTFEALLRLDFSGATTLTE